MACKHERREARKQARDNRSYKAMKLARDVQDADVWKHYLFCEQQRVDSHVRECESILRRKMDGVIELQRAKWYAAERAERERNGRYVARAKRNRG